MEPSKKGPCYSWINTGHCVNKDSCQYSHKKFCAFFQRGFCKNGDQCTYLHPKPQKTTRGGQNAEMMQMKEEKERLQRDKENLLRENEKLRQAEAKKKEKQMNKRLSEQEKRMEELSKQFQDQKISNLEDRYETKLKIEKTQGQIELGAQMVKSSFNYIDKTMQNMKELTTKSIESSKKINTLTVVQSPLLALPCGIRRCRHSSLYPHCGVCGSVSYRYAHCSHGYYYGSCPCCCSDHILYCH